MTSPDSANSRCADADVPDEVAELAGADPYAGQPSAVDTARVFERTGYLEMFGAGGQK
ncbi:MAG TPA: hypothetical protein VEF72_09920 [Mycobacterium sp.]|nr:hypothetical protein [Mycobacterium sp.]